MHSFTKIALQKIADDVVIDMFKGHDGVFRASTPPAVHSGSSFLPAIAETAAKSGGKGGKILAGILGTLGLGTVVGAAGAAGHHMSEKSTLDALKDLIHENPGKALAGAAGTAAAAGGSAVGIKKLLSKAKAAKTAKSKPAAKGLAKLKELLKAVKR